MPEIALPNRYVSQMARSPLVLAALADASVPGLLPVSVRGTTEPGADFDTAVITDEQGREWVVRAPATDAAGVLLEAELTLLAALRTEAATLPFALPTPETTIELPTGGKGVVYPFLPGRPVQPGELTAGSGLAASLGQALAAIHDLPTAVGADLGLPAYAAEEYRSRRLLELDQAAGSGKVPSQLLTRWEKALEDVGRWRFIPTLVHGDLIAEHVLAEGDSITGVLDWGEAKIADPADDLAWLAVGADPVALDSVVAAYSAARTIEPDRHLVVRARLAGELALARWLMHGVTTKDSEIVTDAEAMLADLLKDVGEEPL